MSYWTNGVCELVHGDWIESLRRMPSESVHCIVTSPPYFGLRDYSTARWEGGSTECDHSHFLGGNGSASTKQVSSAGTQKYQYRGECKKCGAVRVDAQVGLEPTPAAYVAAQVAGFHEARRVLRNDGVMWLNLGDSYAGSGKGRNTDGHHSTNTDYKQATNRGSVAGIINSNKDTTGLKDKDLIGIPWRVAFALQADGWWLRSDIIWAKPNPMPESVTDRPTKAHEYLFLLTKSATYYYDYEAIKEDSTDPTNYRPSARDFGGKYEGQSGHSFRAPRTSRNKRSVWEIPTGSYEGAHFATFPPALVEPCVLAGCPEGGTVLDPFCGSGTTLEVAQRLGRRGIGIELNADYCALAQRRLEALTIPMALAL